MTARIEKTVFISYRRRNLPWALAIYNQLTHHGYDVLVDYLSIPSGDFKKIIVENIRGRAHFLLVLTPSALERCNEPGDWLRREIETAIDEKRNIIPLMLESFDFGNPSTVKALTGKLENIRRYNGLRAPSEYFFEAMTRLREQFLSVSLDVIIHPIAESAKPIIKENQTAANEAVPIEKEQLSAQEWFERASLYSQEKNFDEAIRCLTESIRLDSEYDTPYYNRGWNRFQKDDLEGAIEDFTEAIRINPNYGKAYTNRGIAYGVISEFDKSIEDLNEAIRLLPNSYKVYNNRGESYRRLGNLEKAIQDFDRAIILKSDFDDAYYNRGVARSEMGDLDSAILDFNKAIRFNPDFAKAYFNRGIAHNDIYDLQGAFADYGEVIRIRPDFADSYFNRAEILEKNKDYSSAITDYQKYLELGGGIRDGDQKEVEEIIKKLKSKLVKKKSTKKKTK